MTRSTVPIWGRRIFAVALISDLSVSAGTFSLDRSVLPGGGGSSSSARFSVDGSIGQPVAVSAESKGTSLPLAERAGFWSQVVRWINVAPAAQEDSIERRPCDSTHVLIQTLLSNDTATDFELLALNSFSSTTTAGGSVFRDGPWLVYQPPSVAPDPTEDSFTYTVRDALGTIATGTVRIRLAAVPAGGAPNATGLDHIAGPPAMVLVHFLAIAGRHYQVETANDPGGPWINSGTLTAGPEGSATYSEPDTGGSRFFRIREIP